MRQRSNSASSEDDDYLADFSELHLHFDNKSFDDTFNENEFIDMVLNRRSDRGHESAFGRALQAREKEYNENAEPTLDFQTPIPNSVASSTPRLVPPQNVGILQSHRRNVLNERLDSAKSEPNQVQKLVVKFDDTVQDKENHHHVQKLKALQTEKDQLQTKIEELGSQNTKLLIDLDTKNKEIEDLHKRIDSLIDSRSVIQKELDSFKEMILGREELQKDLDLLRKSKESLELENVNLKTAVQDQETKLLDSEKRNSELEMKLKEQMDSVAKLSIEKETAITTAAELCGVRTELDNVKKELHISRDQNQTLEREKERLQVQLEDKTQKLLDSEKHNSEVSEQLDTHKIQTEKEKGHLLTELHDARNHLDQLLQERQHAEKRLEDYEYLIESLKLENEKHVAKHGDLNSQLTKEDLKNYALLKLEEIDSLTFVELANNMKQLLHTFGIRYQNFGPYFHFLRQSFDYYEQFALNLHELLYNEKPMNPELLISQNLRKFSPVNVKSLKRCLQGMLDAVDTRMYGQ
ncbi:hypothetical protein KL933_003848 [Ogataea haglerorum]|uniref:Uncharacterized protein n=1 Tax=Ogataea haglerorum TaxID=1937702 RepID=A0AAN6D3I4_9ASCO|nr:hypothetical protein KL915_002576 [Ogataea haglerorum]KAG7708721.1 hypothetical protein KL950_002241 [Ogataea haglerorum]KAG7725800.1 hypothetical protein KL933_003848 [Ogataea haglerorum]KAG7740003.1 hypothetical protein KL932_003266 [Ogataea haglerorum]KAG7787281.1 hypothetical protein KL945_002940 [Ogataea haglerorum]